ncbi:MAG: 3-dehydroquinate synthase family protein [Bacteroidia bacterium]
MGYIMDPRLEMPDKLLQELNPSSVFVLTDKNTTRHCLPILQRNLKPRQFHHLEIEAGEASKEMKVCLRLCHEMMEKGADRQSVLLNLGGGVVTDLGGFTAAIFKRGIRLIHIPTSLMAMTDAALGGKTGLNLGHYKNQLGTFSEAHQVVVHPGFLHTLPVPELRSGFAEMVKHALIADRDLWEKLQSAAVSQESLQPLLQQSMEVKERLVKEDFSEQGARLKLNFGHTIGHALESWSLEQAVTPLKHGEAIAAGMMAEAALSVAYSGLPPEEFHSIVNFIKQHFPVLNFPEPQQLFSFLKADKKNILGTFRFSLLNKIGSCETGVELTTEDLKKELKQITITGSRTA